MANKGAAEIPSPSILTHINYEWFKSVLQLNVFLFSKKRSLLSFTEAWDNTKVLKSLNSLPKREIGASGAH